MAQTTVNERLKFLIGALKLSARAFSAQLEISESSTRNYLDKGTKLNSDYLERIAYHFKNVNLNWLITGEGEIFTPATNSSISDESLSSANTKNLILNSNAKKFSRTQIIAANHGNAIQHNEELADCEKLRDAYKAERDLAQKEVALLREQLSTKDALIASKDETIMLLRGTYSRPN